MPTDQLAEAHELIYRPLRNPDGPPQPQVEYKLRRFVNDYVAPPKSGARLSLALEAFERMRADIAEMGARTPHELMRCAEVTFIRDCAEMAARASLARTESRWGLYHERTRPSRSATTRPGSTTSICTSPPLARWSSRPVPWLPIWSRSTEFTPVGGASRHLGEVHAEQVATAGPREVAPAAPAGAAESQRADRAARPPRPAPEQSSARLLELVALAEEQPELDALRPYLTDPRPPSGGRRSPCSRRRCRRRHRTAPSPPRCADPAAEVRAAAAASLRELVETLPPEPAPARRPRRRPGRARPGRSAPPRWTCCAPCASGTRPCSPRLDGCRHRRPYRGRTCAGVGRRRRGTGPRGGRRPVPRGPRRDRQGPGHRGGRATAGGPPAASDSAAGSSKRPSPASATTPTPWCARPPTEHWAPPAAPRPSPRGPWPPCPTPAWQVRARRRHRPVRRGPRHGGPRPGQGPRRPQRRCPQGRRPGTDPAPHRRGGPRGPRHGRHGLRRGCQGVPAPTAGRCRTDRRLERRRALRPGRPCRCPAPAEPGPIVQPRAPAPRPSPASRPARPGS